MIRNGWHKSKNTILKASPIIGTCHWFFHMTYTGGTAPCFMPCVGDSWGMFRFLNLGPVSSAHRLVAMHLLSLGSATGSSKTSIIFNLVGNHGDGAQDNNPPKNVMEHQQPMGGVSDLGEPLGGWCSRKPCSSQRGENCASVLTVFENTHFLSTTCTSWRYVTGLGGVGMLITVHVNLRHVHIVRYVNVLGGMGMLTFMSTCIHMHIWRYVTGLGGWGC